MGRQATASPRGLGIFSGRGVKRRRERPVLVHGPSLLLPAVKPVPQLSRPGQCQTTQVTM